MRFRRTVVMRKMVHVVIELSCNDPRVVREERGGITRVGHS